VHADVGEATARLCFAFFLPTQSVVQNGLDHRGRLLVALFVSSGAALLALAIFGLSEQHMRAMQESMIACAGTAGNCGLGGGSVFANGKGDEKTAPKCWPVH
jgi:predicted permease